MKIKIYSVLLVIALLFTGCTTKNQSPSETPSEVQKETPSETPSQEVTEITIGMMSSSDVIPYVLITISN